MTQLQTERLILRRWRSEDLEPFAQLNADPDVMKHFPATLSSSETKNMIDRMESHFEERGFGLFAAELLASSEFIGFIGLSVPQYETHFTPCVEIGWRLAKKYWNRGLATEGAREVLRYAFSTLQLTEVVSFTAVGNLSSRRVMEKLRMSHNPKDNFDHPKIAEGHPLRPHVLYRISKNPS